MEKWWLIQSKFCFSYLNQLVPFSSEKKKNNFRAEGKNKQSKSLLVSISVRTKKIISTKKRKNEN